MEGRAEIWKELNHDHTEFEVPLPYPGLLTVEQETEKAMEHRGVMGNDGHLEVVSLPTPPVVLSSHSD